MPPNRARFTRPDLLMKLVVKIYFLVNFFRRPTPLRRFCCKQRAKCNSTSLSQDSRSRFFASNRPRIPINFFARLDRRFYSLVNSPTGLSRPILPDE